MGIQTNLGNHQERSPVKQKLPAAATAAATTTTGK